MEHLDYYELLEQDQYDPEVQYQLGLRYLNGDGIEKDGQKAMHWLQLAAEQGHEQALALLNRSDSGKTAAPLTEETLPDWCDRAEDGDADAQFAVAEYLLRTAPDENLWDIERYLREAADQGHPQACLIMGKEQLSARNYDAAVFYLERARECSISEAAELLSRCYYHGNGVAKDHDKAAELLERAFDWGDAEAKLRIALRYALGDDIFISQAKALAYVAKAQKAGMTDARAVFDARIEAHRQAEEAEAEARRQAEESRRQAEKAEAEARRQAEEAEAEALRNAAAPQMTAEPITADTLPDWCDRAEDGDTDAQFAVAEYLLRTAPDQYQKDIGRYLRDAAGRGHPQACLVLGKKLFDEKDYRSAVPYLNRAWECRIGEAAELLSRCHYRGYGVCVNEEEAAQLLARAARLGGADMCLRVALRYALGDDIFPSQISAMAYVAKAQKAGMTDARAVFDARVEAHRQAEKAAAEAQRQAEKAAAEAQRQREMADRLRLEQEAEEARLAREKKEYQEKMLEAPERLRAAVAAREALQKEAHLEKVCEEGKRVLRLMQLRNRMAQTLLFPGSLIAAFAVFVIASLCGATPVYAVLLGCASAAAAVPASAFVRKGITQQDVDELAQCLEEAQQKRNT